MISVAQSLNHGLCFNQALADLDRVWGFLGEALATRMVALADESFASSTRGAEASNSSTCFLASSGWRYLSMHWSDT